MNKLLELLGTKYSMRLTSDYGDYRVIVNDKDNHAYSIAVPVLEAETAEHDVLLWAVEKCILELKAYEKAIPSKVLNSYGEYVSLFARNHGISYEEAANHPICKARLEVFNTTGK